MESNNKSSKKIDKNRLYNGYYLDEWGVNKIEGAYQLCCDPCSLCELSDMCDRLADDLNEIGYCICLERARDYINEHQDAYFKKI